MGADSSVRNHVCGLQSLSPLQEGFRDALRVFPFVVLEDLLASLQRPPEIDRCRAGPTEKLADRPKMLSEVSAWWQGEDTQDQPVACGNPDRWRASD